MNLLASNLSKFQPFVANLCGRCSYVELSYLHFEELFFTTTSKYKRQQMLPLKAPKPALIYCRLRGYKEKKTSGRYSGNRVKEAQPLRQAREEKMLTLSVFFLSAKTRSGFGPCFIIVGVLILYLERPSRKRILTKRHFTK